MSLVLWFYMMMMSTKDLLMLDQSLFFCGYSLMMVSVLILVCMLVVSSTFMFNNTSELLKKELSMILIMVAVSMFFLSNNFLSMLMFLEMSIIPTSIMMMQMSKGSDKINSLMMMIVINLFGSVPLMMVVLEVNTSMGTTELDSVLSYSFSSNTLITLSALIIFMSKIPITTLHSWLPMAHVASFGAMSMALAGANLKLGTLGIIKLMHLVSSSLMTVSVYIFSFSMVSGMLMLMIVSRFFDIKVFVAVSSIIHMSMGCVMALSGTESGFWSVMMMAVGHSIISCLMFTMVSMMYEQSHSRSYEDIKSKESSNKLFAMMFIVVMLINSGLPPFCGFVSEILTMSECMNYSEQTLFIMSMMMIIPVLVAISMSILNSQGKPINPALTTGNKIYSSSYLSLMVLSFSPLF